MVCAIALVLAVLFSAIITERRRELGVLKAIGARRGQIVTAMLAEAALATGAGGVIGLTFGVLLLRIFERSLVCHLSNIGVPFIWLTSGRMAAIAAACVAGALLDRRGGCVRARVARRPRGKPKRVRPIALKGGLGSHEDAYPSQISAGEQRRAVIARAHQRAALFACG